MDGGAVVYDNGSNKLWVRAERCCVLGWSVESHGFAGVGHMFLACGIADHIACLERMNDALLGECTISDEESTDFLRLKFDCGRLSVSGKISDYVDCELRFAFDADQTVLAPLIAVLKKLRAFG